MPWHGANTKPRDNNYGSGSRSAFASHTKLPQRRGGDNGPVVAAATTPERRSLASPIETVEAALNRLYKSYGVAMECVGAWHRIDATIVALTKQKSDRSLLDHSQDTSSSSSLPSLDEAVSSLEKLGRAARTTFETAILGDALVQSYAPAWNRAVQRQLSGSLPTPVSAHPVSFTSASHLATVSQLVYLSLINYADLLMAGLVPRTTTATAGTGILDRGLVVSLQSRRNNDNGELCTLWQRQNDQHENDTGESFPGSSMDDHEVSTLPTTLPEPETDTVQLALAAYLDATALDGTDPTVWIKLACAVRRLSTPTLSIQACHDETRSTLLERDSQNYHGPYRRLERYALERAVTALPSQEPANRLAVQALQECQTAALELDGCEYTRDANDDDDDCSHTPLRAAAVMVTISLPRYSWSTLGRLLWRACHQGSAYHDPNAESTRNVAKLPSANSTMSPLLRVYLPPLLTLPTTVWARVVSWLDPTQIWCLEATCRSVSASVISARAVLDNVSQATQRRRQQQQQQSSSGIDPAASTTTSLPSTRELTRQSETVETPAISMEEGERSNLTTSSHSVPKEGKESEEREETVKRVSKRVQSQLISSGKRAERSHRRNSVEYCLLGAVLGCTVDSAMYQRLRHQAATAGGSAPVIDSLCGVLPLSMSTNATKSSSLERFVQSDKEDTLERLSDSSMTSFLECCQSRGSLSPLNITFHFVAHVSIHVARVFSSDAHGALALSTCLLDCTFKCP
jgi:hypothetical protein